MNQDINTSFKTEISGKEQIEDSSKCYHCGAGNNDVSITTDGHYFCCNGCLFVYELLKDNELDNYYELLNNKGLTPAKYEKNEFQYLDDPKIIEKLLEYSIGDKSGVTFFIPEIYCSACIWLLENLYKLNRGIISSTVNFLKKELTIVFNNNDTSLRGLVELLTSLGYKPSLSLSSIDTKKRHSDNKTLYIKLGIAGFCFGNIMLFAFPEYLSAGLMDTGLKSFLGYLNFILSIPVLYAATVYFQSAITSLRMKHINIDVPISLGIIVVFIRSTIEVFFEFGPGYFDSLSGLVFFLLIGRVFQKKTYETLSFERDYKSYFPLSVIRKKGNEREFIPINKAETGDILIIRNGEIIPTDAILLSDSGVIDYSFVTGESTPISMANGEKIYAGGKVFGMSLEVSVIKKYDHSYLTSLWNKRNNSEKKMGLSSKISDTAAKYFTFAVILIALSAFIYWVGSDLPRAINSLTAVLIIACPCAIALTIPFAYGTALRVLGNNSFFLKNHFLMETLTHIDTLVFDKTGTLTDPSRSKIRYDGELLTLIEQELLKTAVIQSIHPISKLIANSLTSSQNITIDSFKEIPGMGFEARVRGKQIKLGNRNWVESTFQSQESQNIKNDSRSYLSIDGVLKGSYKIETGYRSDLKQMFGKLGKRFKLALLSGDKDSERDYLRNLMTEEADLQFNFLPHQKLDYINKLKVNKHQVMMIGDGLNDAEALNAGNLGVAVTDDTANFTPGSDAILLSDKLSYLPNFFRFADKSKRTVYISYGISLLYNIIGLFFAVQGLLTPLIAAILMPVSSISVVFFTVSKTKFDAFICKLK